MVLALLCFLLGLFLEPVRGYVVVAGVALLAVQLGAIGVAFRASGHLDDFKGTA